MLVAITEIPVRYAETDQMGVVYHANYLIWMELGRTAFIEELGFNYAELEKDRIFSPVIDIRVSYKKPVRFGETATVKTWVETYDGFRVKYGYEIFTAQAELAVTGFTEHVCVKKDSFRPVAFRRILPAWHAAYEKVKKNSQEE